MNIANQARLGFLSIAIAATLWGTVGVVIQALYTSSTTNPLSVGFLRLALSLPVLLLACWLSLGRRAFYIAKRDLGIMVLAGAMTAVYQVCYFAAIAQIGVAAATLITLCTAPLWVAFLASLLLNEELTTGIFVSGACAVLGTALLVKLNPVGISSSLQGILLALGSALGYALVSLCGRALARCSPLQSLTVGFSVGAVVLLPFAVLSGFVISYSWLGWAYLLYLGSIPTAFAYLLYFGGMRYTPATIASLAALLEPLTATILAWWLLGEQFSSLGFLGAALLLGSIGLLYRENLQRSKKNSDEVES